MLISLDGDWSFTYQPVLPDKDTPVPPRAQGYECSMPVPAYWDDHLYRLRKAGVLSRARFNPAYRPLVEYPVAGFVPDAELPFLYGIGWYRKVIDVPQSWQGRLVTVHVGGVALEAWVFLNGQILKHHLGHSTPFGVELTGAIRAGQPNDLVIAVANTRNDRSGTVIRGFQGFSAGIHRSVSLKVAGAARIADCYVYPDAELKRLTWRVELAGELRAAELAWALRDPRTGATMGSGEVAVESPDLSFTTGTFSMKPWSDKAPNLYEIALELSCSEEMSDSLSRPFGMRRLTAQGTSLRLNGRPVFLRGATEHAYFPLTCVQPTDVATHRENIRRMQAIGFNWLRCHTWVPCEEYLQAADELGMLVQVEAPVGFEAPEWEDILRSCRKHPSVVIYCCGNEELIDDPKTAFLREMGRLCKRDAPDALFNPHEALRGVEYFWRGADPNWQKGLTQEPFPHDAEKLAALKESADVFGQYTWGYLSYASVAGEHREIDRRLAVYERPCLSHENGIHGTWADLSLGRRYEGTRIGTGLYDGVRKALDAAGVLERTETYYRNSCAWVARLRKHNVETARKCRLLAGYDFLGPIDCHWHQTGYTCGIMNEFYELKSVERREDVLQYNGESVLLLDCTNQRNLAAGASVEMEMLASLFGDGPLREGKLSWQLTDAAGRVYDRGEQPARGVPNGAVASLGRFRFAAPRLDHAAKLTLKAALAGGEYNIANDWDFWVFPPAGPIEVKGEADTEVLSKFGALCPGLTAVGAGAAPLRVLSRIDELSLAFLSGGGAVVVLGTFPFANVPTSFQTACAGRTEGNMATVITAHPVTNAFPHDGYCDWQFYPMIHWGKAVWFDGLEDVFDPIIEIVGSYKQIRKQAMLFELQVGKGRLICCSMDLDVGDPGAAWFLSRLLRYAASHAFGPARSLAPARIEALIRSGGGQEVRYEIDQALDPNAFRRKSREREQAPK